MQKKAEPKKRTGYHHGHLRSALVEASLKLIAKDGIRGLTLRKVAKMAEVSHAAPYSHFKGKDDLVAAIKQEGFQILRSRIEAVLDPKSPSLAKVAEAYVKFALEHTAMFQVMFRNPIPQQPHKPDYGFIKPGQQIFEMMVEVFSRNTGPEKARMTALFGWALIHGLVSLRIDGPLIHIVPESDENPRFEMLAKQMVEQLDRLLAG